MKKIGKVISYLLSLLLIATATVTGTLAYMNLTVDEFAAMGDHKIDVQLVRQKTDESGNYVELVGNPVLYPQLEGYTENIIRVSNDGNVDTFNRVIIAVPADLDDTVELIKGEGWTLTNTVQNQSCDDVICNIYVYTKDKSLGAGTLSEPAVLGVRLNAGVKQDGNMYVFNGKTYDFSKGLQLKVSAQAIQSAFLQSPETAFEKSGRSDNPWAIAASDTDPVNKESLMQAITTLPTGTKITEKVTEIIFGKRSDYASIMESCYGYPVNEKDPNGVWGYYQGTTDDNGVTTWKVYILSDEVTYLPENCDGLFKDMNALVKVDTSSCDTSFVTSMHAMFQNCPELTYVDVSDWNMSNVEHISQMFYHCSKIDNLDVSKWNTSKVTQMTQMFNGCSNLSYLDTSGWDVSNVTGSFSYMFTHCNKLTAVDVDGWVTEDTKSISYMFLGCSQLKEIDVSNWNTSNVTAMDNAFNGCSSITKLDVSNWDTSKVTTTWQMLQNCSKLTELNLTNWDTSNVENMSNMFNGCKGITELDLSSFNVKKVTKVESMFNNCTNLKTIYVSDNAGWDELAERNKDKKMFASCSKLVGGAGTEYSSQYGAYARIDKGSDAPGYFTEKKINSK